MLKLPEGTLICSLEMIHHPWDILFLAILYNKMTEHFGHCSSSVKNGHTHYQANCWTKHLIWRLKKIGGEVRSNLSSKTGEMAGKQSQELVYVDGYFARLYACSSKTNPSGWCFLSCFHRASFSCCRAHGCGYPNSMYIYIYTYYTKWDAF